MFKRSACVIVTSIVLTATLLAVIVSSCHPVSASQNQEPIEIVSVLSPVGPVTPAGPGVEITLKNVGVEPVISLTATLEGELDTSFDFTFDVTPSHPLQPDRSTSATRTLIPGGGFRSNVSYPLTINATLQNGAQFVYTKLVQIETPLCFIATAAYGTPMAGEIEILCEFRDEYLLTNPVGQALVGLYYRVSPPIAKFITGHPSLKPVVRAGLLPAVAMSTVAINTTPAEKTAIVGLLVLVSVALAAWVRRWWGRGSEHT